MNTGIRRHSRTSAAILLLFTFLASSCRSSKAPRAVTPKLGTRQTGIASWYGHPYHGRRTASGERYDMEQFTAAHRSFSFNTWLLVERLDDGRHVEVRINDRGPFVRGRIVDLSKAGARAIGLLGDGITRVRITVIAGPPVAPPSAGKRDVSSIDSSIPPADPPSPGAMADGPGNDCRLCRFIQIGSFVDSGRAARLAAQWNLSRRGSVTAAVHEHQEFDNRWIVLIGPYSHDTARSAVEALRSTYPGAFIVSMPSGIDEW